jgi:hypothetical protein
VKKITVHTNKFAFKSGNKEIILQDLPGYNSPDESHKEQTDLKLQDADLIILVFPAFGHVDLDNSHVEIIEVSNIANVAITTKEKLFVFLNKIDMISPLSIENIEKKKRKAQEDWDRYVKNIPHNRFITGSAEAHLVEIELVEDEFRALENLRRIGVQTGIGDLIKEVGSYLENERPGLLKQALATLVLESAGYVEKVKKHLNEYYNITSRDDVYVGDAKYYGEVNKWWSDKKEILLRKFQDWYYKEILIKDKIDDRDFSVHPILSGIKQKHIDTVKENSDKLSISPEEIEAQIKSHISSGVLLTTDANYSIRRKHTQQCLKAVESYSEALSKGLDDVVHFSVKYSKTYLLKTVMRSNNI